MYRFLYPSLWFKHTVYHCIMDNGYRFLKKFINETSFKRACFLYEMENNGKLLDWTAKTDPTAKSWHNEA